RAAARHDRRAVAGGVLGGRFRRVATVGKRELLCRRERGRIRRGLCMGTGDQRLGDIGDAQAADEGDPDDDGGDDGNGSVLVARRRLRLAHGHPNSWRSVVVERMATAEPNNHETSGTLIAEVYVTVTVTGSPRPPWRVTATPRVDGSRSGAARRAAPAMASG